MQTCLFIAQEGAFLCAAVWVVNVVNVPGV